MYVYRQLGISLPHFTGSQFMLGERVAREDLAPGDIVFFYPRSYGPGHEGLYIGGGKFVHAPSTGDVVKISSLSEPGYAFGYMGAVRPVLARSRAAGEATRRGTSCTSCRSRTSRGRCARPCRARS